MFMMWEATYRVGVQELDEQRQALIDLINQLDEALSRRESVQEYSAIIAQLMRASFRLFSNEESLLCTWDDAGYDKHIQAHDIYVDILLEFQQQLQAGRVLLTTQVLQFLKEWWTTHILSTDKHLAEYLNPKGSTQDLIEMAVEAHSSL